MSKSQRFERWVCTTAAGFLFAVGCMPILFTVAVCAICEAFR